VKTALKLNCLPFTALIDDCHIVATPYFETAAATANTTTTTTTTTTTEENKENAAVSEENDDNNNTQESKAKSRIVAEILANGYILQDQVVAKGLEYDSKYSLSSRLTGYLTTLTSNVKQIDEKYRIWDKAVEIDNKYKIQEKVQNAAATAQTTATAALQSPTGQKAYEFANQTLAQIAAVHIEAKMIQNEKAAATTTDATTAAPAAVVAT
jgi:hypothetical protein